MRTKINIERVDYNRTTKYQFIVEMDDRDLKLLSEGDAEFDANLLQSISTSQGDSRNSGRRYSVALTEMLRKLLQRDCETKIELRAAQEQQHVEFDRIKRETELAQTKAKAWAQKVRSNRIKDEP